MKWLLIVGMVLTVIATLAGVIALIGSRLPRAHVASRATEVPAPPEAVWQAITDVDAFPMWRSDVARVERLPDRAGKTTWVEHSRSGRIPLTIERTDPPRMLVTRIADPDLPFGGTWTYEIAPAPAGSSVKITEAGEIYNPFFRFMARFVFGYETTMASYLAALGKKFAAAARR